MDFDLENGSIGGDAINNADNIGNMFSFADDDDLNMNNIAMYLGDDIDALFGDVFIPSGANDQINNNNNNEQHPSTTPGGGSNNNNNPNLPTIQNTQHLADSARNIIATLDGIDPGTGSTSHQQQNLLQPGQVIMLPNGQTVQLVLQPPSNNNTTLRWSLY